MLPLKQKELLFWGGGSMEKISEEFARILVNRIIKAMNKIKYYPATYDVIELSKKVVEPYINKINGTNS